MTATRPAPGPAAGRRPPAGQPGGWSARSGPSCARCPRPPGRCWRRSCRSSASASSTACAWPGRPATRRPWPAFDPTAVSLTGVQLAAIAVGVLGVLLVAGEYATGLIRTSFTAVPRRLPVLWGKAVVLALTTLAVCLPATLIAFLVGQSILSEKRLDIALRRAWPGGARAARSTSRRRPARPGPGRAAAQHRRGGRGLLGLLFGPQLLVGLLPSTWSDQLYRYLPVPAGAAVAACGPTRRSSSLERVRPVLPLRRGGAGAGGLARWSAVTPEARRGAQVTSWSWPVCTS